MTKEQEQRVTENIGLIYGVIKKNTLVYRIEDLLDIGYIALCKASIYYDENNNNAEFSTYATKAIKNAISTEYKAQNTLKRINPNKIISYDAILSNGDEDTDKKEKSYLDIFVDEKGSGESIVDVEDVLERMFGNNEIDLLIARGLIIYGYTLTMIKNLYHLPMSYQAISQRRDKIFRKLSKLRGKV